MKVFIWERINKATNSYHTEGGLVVIAETEAAARELFISRSDSYSDGCGPAADEAPDLVLPTNDDAQPKVFIFPDAGCC